MHENRSEPARPPAATRAADRNALGLIILGGHWPLMEILLGASGLFRSCTDAAPLVVRNIACHCVKVAGLPSYYKRKQLRPVNRTPMEPGDVMTSKPNCSRTSYAFEGKRMHRIHMSRRHTQVSISTWFDRCT